MVSHPQMFLQVQIQENNKKNKMIAVSLTCQQRGVRSIYTVFGSFSFPQLEQQATVAAMRHGEMEACKDIIDLQCFRGLNLMLTTCKV